MAKFEEDLTQLEAVVARLERGDLTLDESVRLFEDGTRLAQTCKVELEQAEGRVQVLLEGRNGTMHPVSMDNTGRGGSVPLPMLQQDEDDEEVEEEDE